MSKAIYSQEAVNANLKAIDKATPILEKHGDNAYWIMDMIKKCEGRSENEVAFAISAMLHGIKDEDAFHVVVTAVTLQIVSRDGEAAMAKKAAGEELTEKEEAAMKRLAKMVLGGLTGDLNINDLI